MLTKEYFTEAMPSEILTQSDYEKLVEFVKMWPTQSEGAQGVYDFVIKLEEKDRKELEIRLMRLIESFLRFGIKKASFITDILNDNSDKLSKTTKDALINYGNIEFDRNVALLDVLELITKIFKKGN